MNNLASAKVGILFGTDTGNTEAMAEKINDNLTALGCDCMTSNIIDLTVDWFEPFDLIIMGIPTWDFGGIQEDWENWEELLPLLPLHGKVVALYGMGDQLGYGDYFVDAMGWLYEKLQATGAQFIGRWSTAGYDFEASLAVNKDKSYFCGLAIDDDQQFDLTDERIANWITQLQQEYATIDRDAENNAISETDNNNPVMEAAL